MSDWQPIETAPKDRRIRLWAAGAERHGRWDDDRYSKKPRPFWSFETVMGTTFQRTNQPTHWMECPEPPRP